MRVITHRVEVLRDALEQFYQPPMLPPRSAGDPLLGDIAMFPEVRAIVELPNDIDIYPDAFAYIIHQLPALSARWRSECKFALGEILRQSYKEFQLEGTADGAWTDAEINAMGNADLVDLAASVFECCHCKHLIRTSEFLSVLSHRCEWNYSDKRPIASDIYLRGLRPIASLPWTARQFRTEVANIARLRRVTSLLGVDWKTATSKALDNSDPWFICTCMHCHGLDFQFVSRWDRAVSHFTWPYMAELVLIPWSCRFGGIRMMYILVTR